MPYTPQTVSSRKRAKTDPRPRRGAASDDASTSPEPPVSRWIHRFRWPVVLVWLVAVAALAGAYLRDAPEVTGNLYGLIATEHRSENDALLLLRLKDDAPSGQAGTDTLASGARDVVEHLGARHRALAPPTSELAAWLDQHALYLLPVERHEALRQRLSDEAILDAVESLRARLSSPFFNLGAEQARRDPLGLRRLSLGAASRSELLTGSGGARTSGVQVTSTGALLARDGRSILVGLDASQADADALLHEVRGIVAAAPIEADLVGPRRRDQIAANLVRTHGLDLVLATLAAITVVLALALRRVRPAVAITLSVGSTAVGLVWFIAPIGPLDLAMLVLFIGFGCEGALHLQRISSRGWPATLVLSSALIPLVLSDYPTWRQWVWWWLGGLLVMLLVLCTVLPALLAVMGGGGSLRGRGFVLRPMRTLSLVVAVSLLGIGAWASEALPYRGADRLDLGDWGRPPEQVVLYESFFDPNLVAVARTEGASARETLSDASGDARLLQNLVPAQAVWVESPALVVLPEDERLRRAHALADLDLKERLAVLRSTLEAHGFRPAAFGEFMRSASDPSDAPTPGAALDGPLGPWIRSYMTSEPDSEDERWTLSHRVHLSPDSSASVPLVTRTDGSVLELRGPVVAARRDRDRFRDWLGIYVMLSLWLGALMVWLGTRSLAIALSATFSTLITHTAVLTVLLVLDVPLGPVIVPAMLIVGAAATIAAGRACRAVDLRRSFFAMGLLTTSLCQIVAGLTLVATDVPVWVSIGLVTAVGASVASGVGLFVAPGLTHLLRAAVVLRPQTRVVVAEGPQAPPPEDDELDPDDESVGSRPAPGEDTA